MEREPCRVSERTVDELLDSIHRDLAVQCGAGWILSIGLVVLSYYTMTSPWLAVIAALSVFASCVATGGLWTEFRKEHEYRAARAAQNPLP